AAEAATARRDLAQLEQERVREAGELETVRAELEGLRAARQQAKPDPSPAVAAATAQQLAQLESEHARQGAELEAAYTMLNSIRGEIEGLRAALHESKRETRSEPMPQVAAAEPQPATATAAPPRPTSPCAQAVQGKVRLGPKGSRAWPEGS